MTGKKLFISYPHKPDHCVENVILNLKNKLAAKGYDVWLDERIKTGHDWRLEITKRLQESQWVLIFLSEHSTRVDSICLDEMAMAVRLCPNQIISVLLEAEAKVKTPLILGRIQFLRMEEWEHKFETDKGGATWDAWLFDRADDIVAAFELRKVESNPEEIDILREILDPDQYWDDIAHKLEGFVGREWIIKEVINRLKDREGPRLLWLHGGPGSGKTSIAARLAHDLELPAAGIYFCRFDRKRTHSAEKMLRTLAFQMACTIPTYRQMLFRQLFLQNDSGQEKIQTVRQMILDLTASELFKKLLIDPVFICGEPHLLILDGLDEITTDGGASEIAKLLAAQDFKNTPNALRILITSRPDAELNEILSGVESIQLHAKGNSNLNDLRIYLEGQDCLGEGDARRNAIDTLLARSEGAFIYVRTAVEAILCKAISPGKPDTFPADLKGLYRTYLERSYPEGELFRKIARPVLELILASPEPVPVDVAISVLGTENDKITDFCIAMGALIDMDLLEQGQRLSLFHRSFEEWLVQAAPPYKVDKDAGRPRLAKILWRQLIDGKTFGDDDYLTEALPLLLAGLTDSQRREVLGKPSAVIIDTLDQAAKVLETKFLWQHVIDIRRVIIKEVELLYGAESSITVSELNKLAVIHNKKHNYDAAIKVFEQALSIQYSLCDENNVITINILVNLAHTLQSKGDYAAALPIYEMASNCLEKINDHVPLLKAQYLSGFAQFNSDMGNYDAALALYRQAIATLEDSDENSQMAKAMNNLASLLQLRDDYDAATPLLEQALTIEEGLLGKHHPNIASILVNIASSYRRRGDDKSALPLLERALSIQVKANGVEHLHTAAVQINIALLFQDGGNYVEAKSLLEQALATQTLFLGPGHPDLAPSLNNLAMLHQDTGNFDDALSLYEESLAIRERAFGKEHPEYAKGLSNLGTLQIKRGVENWEIARSLFEQALSIQQKMLPAGHENTLLTLDNLNLLLQVQRNHEGSRLLMRQALRMCQEGLGQEHSETLRRLEALCAMEIWLGNYVAARPIVEQLLSTQEKVFGKNHPNTSHTRECLHDIYKKETGKSQTKPLKTTSIAPNSYCPCNSGKKYNKCCGL